MRHLLRKLTMVKGLQEITGASVCSEAFTNDTKNGGYREAIKALNQLQTNASVLQEIRERLKQRKVERNENVPETRKFLARSGISLEDLDALPIIHVAGTKGKGSTCALCESILRHYGMWKMKQSSGGKGMNNLPSLPVRTGLYTSPHLIEVRERIQLNGRPISHNLFTMYFWKVYNVLMEKREHEKDMPPYFKFLTVLAFNIFIREGVDVAIIEVGIGGESDCTNIIRKPIAVGITTLGIDHQKILGETLDKIAWQKAGIMKKGCPAFTALGQAPVALDVLEERAKEKEVTLKVCPPLSSYSSGQSPLNLSMSPKIQELNASLALQLSNTWIKWHKQSSNDDVNVTSKHLCMASPFEVDVSMVTGLRECKWPGRTQILRWHDSGIIFFLDGAHTVESVKSCLEWFEKESRAISVVGSKACATGNGGGARGIVHWPGNGDVEVKSDVPEVTRVLLFNSTGERSIEDILAPFAESRLFHSVLFSPNFIQPSVDLQSDLTNLRVTHEHMSARCQEHQEVWLKHNQEARVVLHSCVGNAIASLKDLPKPLASVNGKPQNIHVLVSGSLHLVGSVLSIVDPDLSHSLSQQSFQNHNNPILSPTYHLSQGSKCMPPPA